MQGYNVGEINELMNTMNSLFNQVGEYMGQEWGGVVSTMQAEWVGTDEQSYEETLAKRFCELYNSCAETVTQSMTNIRNLEVEWENMQNKNALSDANITGISFSLEVPSLNIYDISSIIKKQDRTFYSTDNMGLTNGTQSGQNIVTKVTQYTDGIRTKIDALFGPIDASKAFLDARQSDAVTAYVKGIGEVLKKVNTDVEDMTNALATLAGTNYETMVSGVQSSVNTATGNLGV